MAEPIQYVYAVVDNDPRYASAPAGIDDLPVRLESEGEIAALVTAVDGTAYEADQVEAQTADLGWLGPRARAHDSVVTWAGDQGAVVPLPMFSLFRDIIGVRAMLRERHPELVRALARVRGHQEFIVRLFRIEDELASQLAVLSPRVAELERTAGAASPGQRYLIQRKLEKERATELSRVASETAQGVYDALVRHAADGTIEPIPRQPREGSVGPAVLNASFLLPRNDTQPFQRELTALIAEHQPRGFRFEFTGPWPPYHFVRERE